MSCGSILILRFIPAHAGNTDPPYVCRTLVPVHPRPRGEHQAILFNHIYDPGSSPPTRGTLIRFARICCKLRFIPAHAGNTGIRPGLASPFTVHPRPRGEHGVLRGILETMSGSSPPTRGTLPDLSDHPLKSRFIPAHAGNTNACCSGNIVIAVHPRPRGEHYRRWQR